MSFFTINGTFIDGFTNIEHFDTPIIKSSRSPESSNPSKLSKKTRDDPNKEYKEYRQQRNIDIPNLEPSKYNQSSTEISSSPSDPYLLPRIKRPSRRHNIPKPRSYINDYLTPQFNKLEQELKSQFTKVPTNSLLFLPNDDGNLNLLNRNSSEIDQLNPFRFFDKENNNSTLGIKSNNDICITKRNKTICIPDRDFSEEKPKKSPKKKLSTKSPKASPKKKTPKRSPKASPKKRTPKKRTPKKRTPKKRTPKKRTPKKRTPKQNI